MKSSNENWTTEVEGLPTSEANLQAIDGSKDATTSTDPTVVEAVNVATVGDVVVGDVVVGDVVSVAEAVEPSREVPVSNSSHYLRLVLTYLAITFWVTLAFIVSSPMRVLTSLSPTWRILSACMCDLVRRKTIVEQSCKVPVTAVLTSITLHMLTACVSVYGASLIGEHKVQGLALASTWFVFHLGGKAICKIIAVVAAVVWAHDDGIKNVGDIAKRKKDLVLAKLEAAAAASKDSTTSQV